MAADDGLSQAMMARKSTPKKTTASKAAFLVAFEETGRVDLACKRIGMGRRTHYNWLERDPVYRKQFDKSRKIAVQLLEDEAMRRAVEGVQRAVTVAGVREIVREYSDTLLIFLLKGAMPEKYRERWTGEITGKDGRPLLDLAAVRAFVERDKGADE